MVTNHLSSEFGEFAVTVPTASEEDVQSVVERYLASYSTLPT